MTKVAFERVAAEIGFLGRLGFSANGLIKGSKPADISADGAHDEDNGKRPLNHFYDPLHESALVFKNAEFGCIPFLGGDFTARQWATVTPINTYGLAAAKQQLIGVIVDTSSGAREQHAATLFESLGHMMHLVQDMAQPQHTRNDAHPTSDNASFLKEPTKAWLDDLGLWSRYENWCRDNLNVKANPAVASSYVGYPIVSLPSYGAYFKANDGRGLAEYSNRNFVTEHTNYSDPWCDPFYFAEPSELKATPRQETHSVTTTKFYPDGRASIDVVEYNDTVLSYPTFDGYTGSTTVNPNHSFYSYYDYELKKEMKQPVYSLPEAALASQAALLVPRAVGYSAGFLVHFFRGSISAGWTKNADGTYTFVLTNTSSEPLSNLKVIALYTVSPGTHGAAAGEDLVKILDQQLDSSIVLAPGATTTIPNLTVPGLQKDEDLKTFERRIAVTGTLGSEPGAVIGLVQKGEQAPVRIEVTWDQANPATVLGFAVIATQSNLGDVTWSEPYSKYPCPTYKHEDIPGSSISSLGAYPMTFKGPAQQYIYQVWTNGCKGLLIPPTPIVIRVFLDKVQVREENITLVPYTSANLYTKVYP